IGGGPANSVSLIEILDRLREITGESVDVEFGPWRHGDQKYYVSNTEKFRRLAGWSPRVNVDEGLTRLHAWLVENRAADGRALSAKRVRAH
ncbi:MAG TPA: NAD-dependent dehydratase, partial [Planctomycetota bacterium]|nr:NAD-dependent dehydratase [Planctomycetota bacterium]